MFCCCWWCDVTRRGTTEEGKIAPLHDVTNRNFPEREKFIVWMGHPMLQKMQLRERVENNC